MRRFQPTPLHLICSIVSSVSKRNQNLKSFLSSNIVKTKGRRKALENGDHAASSHCFNFFSLFLKNEIPLQVFKKKVSLHSISCLLDSVCQKSNVRGREYEFGKNNICEFVNRKKQFSRISRRKRNRGFTKICLSKCQNGFCILRRLLCYFILENKVDFDFEFIKYVQNTCLCNDVVLHDKVQNMEIWCIITKIL